MFSINQKPKTTHQVSYKHYQYDNHNHPTNLVMYVVLNQVRLGSKTSLGMCKFMARA